MVAYPLGDLRRQEPLARFRARRESGHLDQQAVIDDRTREVVVPQPGSVGLGGASHRLQQLPCGDRERRLNERRKPAEPVAGVLLLTRSREEQTEPARRRSGSGKQRVEVRGQRAQVRRLRRDHGLGSLVAVEFGEQFGLVSGARVRVEPHPGFLLHCRLQLAGGGDHLGRGLRADPRDGPQPVRPSRGDRANRPEARLLDGGEPQTTLGDLLDPVQGHLRHLRADDGAADRLEGTARRLAACLGGREGVGDRGA